MAVGSADVERDSALSSGFSVGPRPDARRSPKIARRDVHFNELWREQQEEVEPLVLWQEFLLSRVPFEFAN